LAWNQTRTIGSYCEKSKGFPSFISYFVVGVVFLAGLGVWAELKRAIFDPSPTDLTSLKVAIDVFYPSLGCASMLQLTWGSDTKTLRSFAQFMTFLFTAVFFATPSDKRYEGWVIAVGTVFSLVALWCWWIANARATEFHDVDPDAPTGGNISGTLTGSLAGFAVD
jgi:hypothetical protein